MAERVIGERYRVVGDLVGFGGFGRVWQAWDTLLDVPVAVKEVTLPVSATPAEHAERVTRAEREARNAAKLRDHPHIVAVHDVVVENDLPLLVMRFVDGITLAEHLRRDGPLSVPAAAELATGMLSALEHAHAAGIVHRDVKPANIMLATDGRALLTDFGIAVHVTDTTLTGTGGFIGSMEYMAPERFDGVAEPASDLYALGVTLYEAVEGTSPFHRDSTTGTFSAVLRGDAPPPAKAGRLTPLITGLMSQEARDRPTVAEARALLTTDPPTEVVPGDRSNTKQLPPVETTKEPAKPGAPIAAVLLCVVAAVLAIGYFSNKDNETTADTPETTTTTDYVAPVEAPETETYQETYTETETETETVSLEELSDPCDAPSYDTLDLFGLGAPKPESDDSSRTCYWYTVDDGASRSYGILSLSYLMGDPEEVIDGDPISVAGMDAVMQDNGDTCVVVWPTSFGKAAVMGAGDDSTASPTLCEIVELWANELYVTIPG